MNDEGARQGAPDSHQLHPSRAYPLTLTGHRPALEIRVEPEELAQARLLVLSPADETRVLDDLRARRGRILEQVADAIDQAIEVLERRRRRHRWTPGEIRGRRAA